MKTLSIEVKNKIAQYDKTGGAIVCGNGDYQIEFSFDSEWDAHADAVKVALFFSAAGKEAVEFVGNICPVPVMIKTGQVEVGVYVKGTDCATTTTSIPCTPCVLCKTAPQRSGSAVVNGDSVFVRYSANADGTDFTEEWSEGQKYIGLSTGQSAPTDKSAYTWSLFAPAGVEFVGSVTVQPEFDGNDYWLGEAYGSPDQYNGGDELSNIIMQSDMLAIKIITTEGEEIHHIGGSGIGWSVPVLPCIALSRGSDGFAIAQEVADVIFGEVFASSVTFFGYKLPKS